MKQTVLSQRKSGRPTKYDPRQEVSELTFCALAWPENSARDAQTTVLSQLASEVIAAEIVLGEMGYPKQVWEGELSQFEAGMLNDIERTKKYRWQTHNQLAGRLITRLNEYRATRQDSVPKVGWDAECGGRGDTYTILTDPAGGQVQYIPAGIYLYCERQGIDPKTSQCDQWSTARHGAKIVVEGAYRYRVFWRKDGRIEYGDFKRVDFNRITGDSWTVE